jgi:hypothetical protein
MVEAASHRLAIGGSPSGSAAMTAAEVSTIVVSAASQF